MNCTKCGQENKKGAKFCEACGAQLPKAPRQNPLQALSKKAKILIGLGLGLLVALIIAFCVLGSQYKPEKIAEGYFVAAANNDMDKLYSYMGVKDKGLTSKKIFKKIRKDDEAQKLLNYSVSSINKSDDGLSASVVINYTLKGDSKSSSATINLVKDKNNKLLFFDNWKISEETSVIVEDYEIGVLKGAKVKLEGVTLDKSYIDSKKSDDNEDVYVIPEIFKGEYEAEVTLKNGLTGSGTITPSSYGSANLNNLSITKEGKNTLEKTLPTTINKLYQAAIEQKAFNDIKADYEYKGSDLKDLDDEYTSLMEAANSRGLKKYNATKVEITDSAFTDEGYIEVKADVDYEYTVTYSFLGEEETKNGTDNDNVKLTFDYVDGQYKLIDMSGMTKYFSWF